MSFARRQILNLKSTGDWWPVGEAAGDDYTEQPANGVAVLGRKLSCGLFGIGDDFIEKYQSLDERFVKNRHATFFFEATGDSMQPLIFAGDILVVDRSLEAFNGQVCVVALEGELICKRVYRFSDYVLLRSENPKYKDIRVDNPDSVMVWGVVVARAGELR